MTFEELLALYLQDYQINGRKPFGRVQELMDQRTNRLAHSVSSNHIGTIRGYVVRCDSEGMANVTSGKRHPRR